MRPLFRWITGLLALLLIGSGLVLELGMADPTATADQTEFAQSFPKDTVIPVSIQMSETDLADLLANGRQEKEYLASVDWSGTSLPNVAIRAKGNSSLSQVAASGSKRYSLKLDLDAYITGQSLDGVTIINLQNNFSDPTFLRETLSYEAFASMGVPTPLTTWVELTVNGEHWGLYPAVEQVSQPMLERFFANGYGDLYKPESMVGQGADLKWYGDSMENYPGIVYKTKNKTTNHQPLLQMLDALNNGGDLERYLDVDEILRYWAVSALLSNFDSYPGSMLHNYYLYEQNGRFSLLPWDLNMSFGGFGGGSREQMVNLKIDEPTTGPVADRPLIAKLLEVPEYRERYHGYIQELIEGYFEPTRFEARVRDLAALIDPHVQADPTKFYTYEQFQQSLDQDVVSSGFGGGQMPGGQVPGSQALDGQVPGGQVPGGQMPGGQVPGGQMPGGQVPDGQAPGGQMPGGRVPGGQVPGRQVPGDPVPGGQMPGGQMPGGRVPGGQVPGGQVPGGQVPGGQVPGGQVPGGQVVQPPIAAGAEAATADPTAGQNEQPRIGQMGGGRGGMGSAPALIPLVLDRVANVQKQLAGELPTSGDGSGMGLGSGMAPRGGMGPGGGMEGGGRPAFGGAAPDGAGGLPPWGGDPAAMPGAGEAGQQMNRRPRTEGVPDGGFPRNPLGGSRQLPGSSALGIDISHVPVLLGLTGVLLLAITLVWRLKPSGSVK